MAGSLQSYVLDGEVHKPARLNTLVYLPESYQKLDKERWPLLLFLHGSGERGNDLEKLKLHGIPRLLNEGVQFPFIILAPQCPEDQRWADQIDVLNRLLEDAVSRYSVDTSRIYLTGLSLGGSGTWHLAMLYPHWFAAIAPVCGFRPYTYGYKEKLQHILDIPVWAFHGALDEVVLVEETQLLSDALAELGGIIRLTIYPEANHRLCWEQAYDDPDLYDWFLSQSKETPRG